jgi:molybdopterin biosynthesis enzyme
MANGLIVVPEGVARIMAGEKVRIRLLDTLNQL